MKTNKEFFPTQGKVIELINKKEFRVKCDNGRIIKANVASRFRTKQGRRRAKIVEGDRVVVEIIMAEPEKGQIVSLVDENYLK
jgi:translation initiation factor IF-1